MKGFVNEKDLQNFENIFDTDILSCINFEEIQYTEKWFSNVILKNVPNGKKIRGIMVVLAYRLLKKNKASKGELKMACILGWCVEMLQASCLIVDDVMDGSSMRRGQPCWYRQSDVGFSAINDSMFLQYAIFEILHKHFGHLDIHSEIVRLFHNITFKTIHGQCLDTRIPMEENLEKYTVKNYEQIVRYKTSFYTFYLPISLAMTLMPEYRNNKAALTELEDLSYKLGLLYQIQDDYLDCFGNPEITGKIGTDIIDKKVSWLIVKSLETCNEEQKATIIKHYGRNEDDSIGKIKNIYQQLDIQYLYEKFESNCYENIVKHIEGIENLPAKLFIKMLDCIYSRAK